MSNVLAIPDLHCPFEHRDSVAFLKEVYKKYRINKVKCLGDEGDQHYLSEHSHDTDGDGPMHEWEKMIAHLEPVYRAFPEVESHISNHTSRPYRRANNYGIPSVYLRRYGEFMCAPAGWTWHDHTETDGVRYFHGEGYSGPLGALKAAQAHMQTVCIGHLHSYAGVLWNANPKHLFAGLNAGCLIDRGAYAFNYAKHSPAKPILGCGVIIDGLPQFVPMQLTRSGRWNGEV